MNILESEAIQKFRTLDWTAHRKSRSGDAILSLDDGDSELRAILQMRQLPSEQKMGLSLSTSSKNLSRIIVEIVGECTSHEILAQTRLEKRSPEIGRKEIEDISNDAILWWRSQDTLAATASRVTSTYAPRRPCLPRGY